MSLIRTEAFMLLLLTLFEHAFPYSACLRVRLVSGPVSGLASQVVLRLSMYLQFSEPYLIFIWIYVCAPLALHALYR
ncbi:hypothetical protein EV356DRAFT_497761 [Viridothelium virens]|uniref:Secreted protein n=1 Tax=Viridothelium virens TaxID=1048519 RepID=A0A6A6HFW1_VIRVR|nr:hypothetical protein EV356DRAFT_497761 [Viridothelium virens]